MKTMLKRILRSQGGFTLIELLAVLAIISVLAGIVTAAVSGTKDASTESQVQSDAQSTQSATDNFKTADISGTGQKFPDKLLNSERVNITKGIVTNIYNDVFNANAEAGTNVLLVTKSDTGVKSAETLGDKVIPSGSTSTAEFLFNGIDFTNTAKVQTRDAAGDVVTSTFVPDFLPKAPSSLVLKGEETADLGKGDETGSTSSYLRSGNTYEEYLWVYRSLGSGANKSRSVEVYRLSEARCSTAALSSAIGGASPTTDDDPLANLSLADVAKNAANPAGQADIANRIQANSDQTLSPYTAAEISLAQTASGTSGVKPCDTTNSFVVLLVYDRIF